MEQSLRAKDTEQTKVFIGIPIGPPKLYSTYYMVASLANLDYENVEIHWAVTGGYDAKFEDYRARLTKLCEAVDWPRGWSNTIHYVPLTNEQLQMPYGPILENKNVLRQAFLDSDCDYFLLLGGDNPPPRHAVKHLMAVNADVAMGTCYQRPGVTECGVYPLVWRYTYSLEEVDACDADPASKELMRQAWLVCPSVISVSYDPDWQKDDVLWTICGGDGCALIKRRVLETIDWAVRPPDNASSSEDMYFMSQALYYGYSTACLTTLHIPHMAESGLGV